MMHGQKSIKLLELFFSFTASTIESQSDVTEVSRILSPSVPVPVPVPYVPGDLRLRHVFVPITDHFPTPSFRISLREVQSLCFLTCPPLTLAVWLRFCAKPSQLLYSTRWAEELCGSQRDKAHCQISPTCCPQAVSGTQSLHGLWVPWGGLQSRWSGVRFSDEVRDFFLFWNVQGLLPPSLWVSPRTERSGNEADHLPPSSTEVTNGRSHTSPKCSDDVHRDCILSHRAAEFPSVYEFDTWPSDLNKQQELQVYGVFETKVIRTQKGWCK